MARPLRIQYSGAIYHVMSRGDRRQDIFRQPEDRLLFLETLAGDAMAGARLLLEEHFDSLAPLTQPSAIPSASPLHEPSSSGADDLAGDRY